MTYTELREALIGKEIEYCRKGVCGKEYECFTVEEVSYTNPPYHTRTGGIAIKGGGEVYYIIYSEALRLAETGKCGMRYHDTLESEVFRFKEREGEHENI